MIYTLPLGPLATNTYIITDDDNAGVIVDPAANADKIKGFLDEEKIDLKAILLTHAHYDHIGAVSRLLEYYPGMKCYCSPKDEVVFTPYTRGEALPAYLKPADYKDFRYTDPIEDGMELEIGKLKFKFIETPGHTPGSVVILCDNIMFSGDTLFKGSIGRCDLTGGDKRAMMESLKKLLAVEGNYIVCPGHEAASTLDEEKKTNPYMRLAAR